MHLIPRLNSFHISCLQGILVQIELGEATFLSGIALGIGMAAVLVSVDVSEKSRVVKVLRARFHS